MIDITIDVPEGVTLSSLVQGDFFRMAEDGLDTFDFYIVVNDDDDNEYDVLWYNEHGFQAYMDMEPGSSVIRIEPTEIYFRQVAA